MFIFHYLGLLTWACLKMPRKLPVTTFCHNQIPTIGFNELNSLTRLHD